MRKPLLARFYNVMIATLHQYLDSDAHIKPVLHTLRKTREAPNETTPRPCRNVWAFILPLNGRLRSRLVPAQKRTTHTGRRMSKPDIAAIRNRRNIAADTGFRAQCSNSGYAIWRIRRISVSVRNVARNRAGKRRNGRLRRAIRRGPEGRRAIITVCARTEVRSLFERSVACISKL